jgi:hypothetical protein
VTDSATIPQPPRTVRVALVAIGAQIVFTLISAALFWGYGSERRQQLVNSNKKLKTPKNPYTAADITHDLHSVRVGVTIQSIIVCALFALAAVNIYRGRGIARWLYIAAAVIFSVGGIVALGQSGPGASNLASFAVAISAIAAIVLLIMPESSRYFLAIKALRMPPGARNVGGAAATRPAGLRGLFAPPPPRAPRVPRDPSANGKASAGGADNAEQLPPGGQPGRSPRPAGRKPATTRPANSSGTAATSSSEGQETTADTATGSSETSSESATGAAPATAADTAIRRKPKVRASAATDGPVPGSTDAATANEAPDASTRSRGKSRRI